MTRNKIVWKIVIIHVLIYLAVFCLNSCGLLKNNLKEKNSAVHERSKQTELQELDLSKVYRESNIYSYRPDGTVAEFEHRREQIDAATMTKLKQNENQREKTIELKKVSSPARLLILAGIVILTFLSYTFWKKFKL